MDHGGAVSKLKMLASYAFKQRKNLSNEFLLIESGTIELDIIEVSFKEILDGINKMFCHVAADKKLIYDIELSSNLPKTLYTDVKRLMQILKNLLSNAFKFTEKGSVNIYISLAESGWCKSASDLVKAKQVIVFSVVDTGIGIPVEKQKIIFEAFQQEDGSTSRKYGGTGLGLSISRETAKLLGGEICLISEEGKGCNFTPYLPQDSGIDLKDLELDQNSVKKQDNNNLLKKLEIQEKSNINIDANTLQEIETNTLPQVSSMLDDDQLDISPKDHVVLIIEDDVKFAKILLDKTHKQGFKGIWTTLGSTGLDLANRYLPAAITLDLHLPDMDGWRVLDTLKESSATRHIPVHLISVDDDIRNIFALTSVLEVYQMIILTSDNGYTAIEMLNENPDIDIVLMDIMMPEMDGYETMREIRKKSKFKNLPIIALTAKAMQGDRENV